MSRDAALSAMKTEVLLGSKWIIGCIRSPRIENSDLNIRMVPH